MVIIKTAEQIQKMQEAANILVDVHHHLKELIVPGISTLEIDTWVDEYLASRGATAEQKGYMGYPYATCASVNDEICHGFPREDLLKDGDIVTIDMVVNYNGWLADSAWSYAVGNIDDESKRLMEVTKESMYKGIEQAIVGNRLGDVGHAIQKHAEAAGFSVVREFVGHGIGKNIHEDPQVLHYGMPGRGIRLTEGMVFTVEPMINMGTFRLTIDGNGWTARTADGKRSAQYEHTIAITENGPIILTDQGELR
ncbi:MAG: type I methionyl aminopeptidase [Tissierellia bacterium]|nr:type I methionyl aminopeptidase [Tissierellia bacterium]